MNWNEPHKYEHEIDWYCICGLPVDNPLHIPVKRDSNKTQPTGKNTRDNRIHKEKYKAGYKKCFKKSNFFGGDLLSNCCAWDFDPFGYEKDEGIWQERCLKCGKICEPLWIGKNDIQNIRDCSKWNDEK